MRLDKCKIKETHSAAEYKNGLKMDHRPKIMGLLEESINVNLCDLGLSNGFLDIITTAQVTQEK